MSTSTAQLKVYTPEEVKAHNQDKDNWLIIEDKVLDVSKFMQFHPAGKGIIMQYAG
jgi:cytochrome b involved in lipid metabolism